MLRLKKRKRKKEKKRKKEDAFNDIYDCYDNYFFRPLPKRTQLIPVRAKQNKVGFLYWKKEKRKKKDACTAVLDNSMPYSTYLLHQYVGPIPFICVLFPSRFALIYPSWLTGRYSHLLCMIFVRVY